MHKPLAVLGLFAAGTALAQPTGPTAIPALTPMQRSARIARDLPVLAGKPVAGPFRVGPGLTAPAPVQSFGMDMVRGEISDAGGGTALFLTTSVKTAVDIQRPMVTIGLKPHAKPYLADCALNTDASGQVAYYDAATPTYHSQVMAKKNVVAVQDGHALFAIAPAAGLREIYVAPITLDPSKTWSMSFSYCEFSQVG